MKVFNVMDYGAAGDGRTDDFPAFAKAVIAAKRDGGGSVFMPPRDYLLNRMPTFPTGVYLDGHPDAVVRVKVPWWRRIRRVPSV